jgi:hypothetical protein
VGAVEVLASVNHALDVTDRLQQQPLTKVLVFSCVHLFESRSYPDLDVSVVLPRAVGPDIEGRMTMSGELVRYRSYGVARQHRAELDAVDRSEELAAVRVRAIGDLTRTAVAEHLMTSLYVAEAVRQDPGGAPEYGLLAMTEVHRLADEIRRL